MSVAFPSEEHQFGAIDCYQWNKLEVWDITVQHDQGSQ